MKKTSEKILPIDGFKFAQTILNTISAHVAILDEHGVILETNKAWKEFALNNNLNIRPEAVQVNYLEICDSADSDSAGAAARGIRQVIAGKKEEFIFDYPCHSPNKKRWFSMRVRHAIDSKPIRVVVSHENITRLKEAEEKSRKHAEDLRLEKKKLEDTNTALKVLLNQRETDQEELETMVLDNIRRLIIPVIEQLARQSLTPRAEDLTKTLQSRLSELTKPFLKKLTHVEAELTPQEIEVAALIREGRTSQGIADQMHLSITTIHFHRRNLRKKLGLNHSGTNLRSFLLSLVE